VSPIWRGAGSSVELFRRLWRSGRTYAVVVLAATLAAGLLPALSTLAMGTLIGRLPGAVAGGAASRRALVAVVAAVVAAQVLQRVCQHVRRAAATIAGIRLDHRAREWIATAVCGPAGTAHLEDPAVRDRIALAQASILGGSVGRFVESTSAALASRLSGLVWAGLIGWFVWWPAGAALVLAWLVADQPYRRYFRRALDAATGQIESQRRTGYLRDLISTPNRTAKEARLFGLQDWLVVRFTRTWLPAMAAIWAERRRAGRWVLPALVLVGAADAGVRLGATLAALGGSLSLAALTVGLGSVAALGGALQFGYFDYVRGQALVAFGQLLELERDLAVAPDRGPMAALDPGPAPAREVRFRGVRFAYPFSDREVLRGVDLAIPAGRSLAIVGANGAGKTTLVKLLCRLSEPTAGSITVDGLPLPDLDLAAWRRRVAAIFQDFAQYPFSAADNVGVGRLDLMGDRAAVDEACRRAGAISVIDSLPRGRDTVLSRELSGGVDLSGGQWQRLALARALLAVAGGARVLILDEPTANLDVRAEAALFDGFLDATRGVTTILISHRFSTVRRADRVCVLEDGAISEQGTHDELLALGGTYARMFRAQAEAFVEVPA
jgi:ATP-binding cassette subfamily B protein